MKHYDSKFDYTARNEEIFHKREIEKRTLKSIGDEYDLSGERIRSIVAKIHRIKLWKKEKRSLCQNPKVMSDIEWNSTRVINCLRWGFKENALEMPIEEFIKNFNYHRLMNCANFGRKALLYICERLEDHGYKDIEHLRSYKVATQHEKDRVFKAVKKIIMTS